MTCPIQPMNNQLLLDMKPIEKMTPGGLHLPSISSPDLVEGTVVASGTGRLLSDGSRVPNLFQPGDVALLFSVTGEEIEYMGEKYRLVVEDDLIGKVTLPQELDPGTSEGIPAVLAFQKRHE